MKKFFFDTANVPFIKKTWESIKNDIDPKYVRGITTNPNAFFKLNKLHLNEWLNSLPELCDIISEIRQDTNGVVYIQGPSADMSNDELLEYASIVSQSGNGHTPVGLKIPPYKRVLEQSIFLSNILELNVTGLSDCSTANKCLTCPVRYISIIPGRMEEAGINAKEHIAFATPLLKTNQEIIAGSMRTLEGLKWTIEYGTVPTIGEKVWTLILEGNNLKELSNLKINIPEISPFSPSINNVNKKLAEDFFTQMNECGKIAYNEYIDSYYNK